MLTDALALLEGSKRDVRVAEGDQLASFHFLGKDFADFGHGYSKVVDNQNDFLLTHLVTLTISAEVTLDRLRQWKSIVEREKVSTMSSGQVIAAMQDEFLKQGGSLASQVDAEDQTGNGNLSGVVNNPTMKMKGNGDPLPSRHFPSGESSDDLCMDWKPPIFYQR